MQKHYLERRERLRRTMREHNLDALLISHAANRYYLSGFELHDPQYNESAGYLIICADGRDRLLTDPRYAESASHLWDNQWLHIYRGDAPTVIASVLGNCGAKIGFEATGNSYAFIRALTQAKPGLSLEATEGLVEKLRQIKDATEIAALERSFALNHAMFTWLPDNIRTGSTEQEVSWQIERFFRENGASELAFASIVAVDANAARPHALPADTVITDSCSLLVDAGCRVDAYCSDQTRTFWLGAQKPEKFQTTLTLVQEAQQAALAVMEVGRPCKEVYATARNIFAQAGVAQFFTHGLGHGVGLETHEQPSLSPRAEGVLLPGMTVTVEPGLYYSGWGGVRWEITVLVEEKGVRVL